MDKWEKALYECDQKLAKILDKIVYNSLLDWNEVCRGIEYPLTNAWKSDKTMNPHFRRTLTEIHLLAVFGDHTWQHFKEV